MRTLVVPAALVASLAFPPAAAPAAEAEAYLAFEAVVRGEGEARLAWPVAVASARPAEIAVADVRPPRLVLFRASGADWTAARVVPLPAAPAGVAASDGSYLVSLRAGGLLEVDAGGAASPRPLPPGFVPGAIAAGPDGRIALHDLARGEVVVDPGRPGARVLRPERPPAGLAIAADGRLFAAIPVRGEIAVYADDGRPLAPLRVPGAAPVPAFPVAVALDARGGLLVVDRHGGRVVVLDREGRLRGFGSRPGEHPGLLRFPAGIALLGDGRVAVADLGNGRVQIFRPARSGGEP